MKDILKMETPVRRSDKVNVCRCAYTASTCLYVILISWYKTEYFDSAFISLRDDVAGLNSLPFAFQDISLGSIAAEWM